MLNVDDSAVYCTSESYVDIILSLRIEASNIVQWLRANRLTLNVSKTKFMLFGTKEHLEGIRVEPLHADGELIEWVYSFKYLGVTLDDSLNFEKHINILYKHTCLKLEAIN